MDPIPGPGQVVAATTDVTTLLHNGRPADLRPMPRTLLPAGEPCRVHGGDDRPRIGSDPRRRYAGAASRTLVEA